MEESRFTEVIDYAIGREEAAARFYRDLQNIARFGPQREILREFAKMEDNHKRKLQTIREKGPATVRVSDAQEVVRRSSLKETPPSPEMDYQEILIAAMKREDNSYTLYSELREQTDDPQLQDIFTMLMNEEAKHKSFFEDLYDRDVQPDN
jgi:rubrerythrin